MVKPFHVRLARRKRGLITARYAARHSKAVRSSAARGMHHTAAMTPTLPRAEQRMTTATQEQHSVSQTGHDGPTDRSLSTAVLTMLVILAVVMGLLVPVGVVLLHGAAS
jgi:hypothetical protein